MSPITAHAPAHAPVRAPSPRPLPASRPDHLRVVRPTERRRARLSPVTGVVLTGVLFALLFAVAIAQTMLVQGQVRLDQLDAELAVEQARYQELRKDVAGLESPGRIVAAAQEQAMVAPDELVYLQPSTPDAPVVGEDAPVAVPGDDPNAEASAADSAWSTMKPLLAAPAP